MLKIYDLKIAYRGRSIFKYVLLKTVNKYLIKNLKKKLICYCFLKIFYLDKKLNFGIIFFEIFVHGDFIHYFIFL
jgi:hypothetical protein